MFRVQEKAWKKISQKTFPTNFQFSATLLNLLKRLTLIMVDESLDVTHKEQASFCVRWVDENLFSYEDFLGLLEMERRT